MFSTTIGEGDVYVHRMAGGGGWGDPLARDPAAVDARRPRREGERRGCERAVRRGDRGRRAGRRCGDGRPTRREEKDVIARADAVVIGAGIMGASTAHFLTKLGFGEVALLEKRKICGGSTQYSAAHVRQHYSNEVGIRLAVRGASMFANAEEELGGPAGFHQIGYMLFAPPEGAQALRETVAVQQGFGVETSTLEPDEVIEPLAPAPARRRRARLLRADVRVRGSRADRGVARSLGATQRAPRLRGLRGARHLHGRWTDDRASSPGTARSRPASS